MHVKFFLVAFLYSLVVVQPSGDCLRFVWLPHCGDLGSAGAKVAGTKGLSCDIILRVTLSWNITATIILEDKSTY